MVHRITDIRLAKMIQAELTELINHSRRFSGGLKDLLKEHDIDIAGEREATVEVLRVVLQKWVVEIIHVLFIEESLRFNEIKRNLEGISSRTLTKKLRLLEDAGFVKRKVVSERPTVVEYSLTARGQTFAELSCPIICYLKLEKP